MRTHRAPFVLLFAGTLVLSGASIAAKKERGHHGGADAGAPAPAASAAPATPASSAAPETMAWPSCSEHVPPGASKPEMKDEFPARATSGYASVLQITIDHGKGETVLPHGFQVQSSGDAARALGEAGFHFPDPDGGAGPSLVTTPTSAGAVTKIAIPLLVLPKEPGRNKMLLPPVPIAVARASGELLTLCTRPHPVTVDDPTASTPEAKPHPNPLPRAQREEWTLAKQLAIGAAIGGALAALLGWLAVRWMRRPRPVPPPPPPRPPWEVAFEELFAVRYAGLAKENRYAEHYDRVSDAVRKYLGGRYGFDGLETTTREMTSLLRRIDPPVTELDLILRFLEECDLVKFARITPSDEDCTRILDQGEHIVRVTVPPQIASPGAPARVPAAVVGGIP